MAHCLVLVIGSSAGMPGLAERDLTVAGFHVVLVGQGSVALHREGLQGVVVDVGLVDENPSPAMDLRSAATAPALPVIALAARADEPRWQRGGRRGIDDVLIAAMTPDALWAKLPRAVLPGVGYPEPHEGLARAVRIEVALPGDAAGSPSATVSPINRSLLPGALDHAGPSIGCSGGARGRERAFVLRSQKRSGSARFRRSRTRCFGPPAALALVRAARAGQFGAVGGSGPKASSRRVPGIDGEGRDRCGDGGLLPRPHRPLASDRDVKRTGVRPRVSPS